MKKIKCPVCGEKTIDIEDKKNLHFKFKSDLKCSNCNSPLRISNLSILLLWSVGIPGGIIPFLDISIIIKTVLLILVTVLYFYMRTYVIPLVKDE